MRHSPAKFVSLLKLKLLYFTAPSYNIGFLGDADFQFTILPLWDWLEGVFLFLDHESNYENADTMFRLRRVLLFAVHPQRVFYEPRGSATLTREDKITLA